MVRVRGKQNLAAGVGVAVAVVVAVVTTQGAELVLTESGGVGPAWALSVTVAAVVGISQGVHALPAAVGQAAATGRLALSTQADLIGAADGIAGTTVVAVGGRVDAHAVALGEPGVAGQRARPIGTGGRAVGVGGAGGVTSAAVEDVDDGVDTHVIAPLVLAVAAEAADAGVASGCTVRGRVALDGAGAAVRGVAAGVHTLTVAFRLASTTAGGAAAGRADLVGVAGNHAGSAVVRVPQQIDALSVAVGIPGIAGNAAVAVGARRRAVRRDRADDAAPATVECVTARSQATTSASREASLAEDATRPGGAGGGTIGGHGARLAAAVAVSGIALCIDAGAAAVGGPAGTLVGARAVTADLLGGAGLVAAAAVGVVRVGIDARITAAHESREAGEVARAVATRCRRVGGNVAGVVAIPAVGGIALCIDAASAAAGEAPVAGDDARSTRAGCGAVFRSRARLVAGAAVLEIRRGLDAGPAAVGERFGALGGTAAPVADLAQRTGGGAVPAVGWVGGQIEAAAGALREGVEAFDATHSSFAGRDPVLDGRARGSTRAAVSRIRGQILACVSARIEHTAHEVTPAVEADRGAPRGCAAGARARAAVSLVVGERDAFGVAHRFAFVAHEGAGSRVAARSRAADPRRAAGGGARTAREVTTIPGPRVGGTVPARAAGFQRSIGDALVGAGIALVSPGAFAARGALAAGEVVGQIGGCTAEGEAKGDRAERDPGDRCR